MIGKNNKKLKELKQGVKVESYSIKKFKFGAASIVIGASIFFGTGVASANEVAASSDSSATNDTNATSGNGDKVPEKINTVSAEKESVASVNKPSSAKEESTKVEVEKKVVDKSLLETSITKLEELLATVNKDKAPASTLSAVNVDLINAKSILENANASQEEVDALVKKLKQQTQIVSSMPKVTTKEKEVKEGANTIANSGSRDSRNGQRMAQGTNFRANGQISKGALADIRYYASVDPNQNGGRKTRNDEPELTRSKTDIKAYYVQDSEGKWIVYDVFFNNDGNKMTGLSKQQEYYFQGPFNIMDLTPDGYYKSNTVKDLYFTRYAPKDRNSGKKLSDGFEAFDQYGNRADISQFWDQKSRIFHNDRVTMYDPRSGLYRDDQKKDVFKNNKDDRELDKLPRNKKGGYPGASYYLGLKLGEASTNYAVHMHAKIKLRDNVTPEEAAQYGRVYAATTTKGWTTNHSYIMGSWSARLQNEPDAPKDPIQGLTVTKTVGDNPGDKINPVSEGYVRHKNGKSFPAGMNWTWAGDKSPNTDVAGVFKYKSIATYKDGSTSEDKGSGSDGTVTLNVKPKKPTITTSLVNKKGLTGQQITVNVQNGVPDGSTVNLYDDTKLIGTGKTSGGTATVTVTVKDALPGNPITAETVVTNNNGKVTSDKSNPVIPTEAPDTQPPTLKISPDKPVKVVEGDTVRFTVTARDDKHVNLITDDFLAKYGTRVISNQVSVDSPTDTDTEKVRTITIPTTAQDVGGHTITFKATDNAGHKANDVTFTFEVTPRDNQKPIVEVGGVRLTETEPKSAQFYVYRGATFNPTVKAWDDSGNIKSMSVENLPKGSQPQTYTAQTGKTEANPYATPLSTGKVLDTETLGDHVARFQISDGKNNATYLMKYKVVDVVAEHTENNVKLNSKSGDPNVYLNTAGEQDGKGNPVVGPQADVHFPGGMNFRWDNAKGSTTNVTLDKVGKQTHKAIAVFPKNQSNRNGIPVFAPETAERNIVFNVADDQKPKASLNGVELSETANEPIFTVYRGATFNPELKVSDNSGVISKVEVKGGLPKGVTPGSFTVQTGKTEATPYAPRLSSGTVLNTETLGVHESTIHVEGSSPSDSRDFKFKYRVVDIETRNLENGIANVPVASTLNKANSPKNIDAHHYLKVVDSEDKADRGNNYLPSGMTWTWKDRNGTNLDPGTTLDNSGKYTRTATAIFPGTNVNNITDANSTTRTTFAPAEIKRQVILAVTPTAPIVEGKENGSVTITPPTRPDSTNKQDIDKITITYVPTGKTTPETVTVTKSGNNWTVNGKTPDKVSVSPEGVVTISDAEVADKTEVTAKVSKNIDNVPLESPVARGTANGPLAAEVTNPAPVPEKAQITPVTVVTPNKPGSSITVDGPVNGLTVDEEGKLKGKPEVNDWKPKEEERTVEIPVKVTKGGETVTVKVPVPILRDTDGDGIPDKEDSDDDNDGIPDTEEEKNGTDPKVADKLTGTVTGKTVPEKTEVPANTKVVTPSKPGTTITVDNPVNGLTVDKDGNLKGTPEVTDWKPKEEERTVEIPVKLKKGTEEVVVKVPITIERDTDGDGIPDKVDSDDDNDGIPDEEEIKNGTDPKVADKLTGTVTGKTVPEKTEVPANTKVVTPSKPGTTITVDKPVNGLTVDKDGNLKGTPEVTDWKPKEEERTVEIPVKLKKGTEEVVVKVPITIERDTDGDGIPDKVDSDDDNDGIPDEEEIKNGTDPKTPTTQTPKIEITQQPNGDAIVTPKKPDGSTYPPGTKVEIPGENGTPITVTIGNNGSGEVPNDNLPKKAIPGTGTVTEPNKNPSKKVPVETPAHKIPKLELEQDPKTGDVTVTPKKPDGSQFPPGTTVEIPGKDKDGNPTTITVTIDDNGKGKVPNSELPEGKVPGTGKITEPGKPTEEVPVETPSKIIPGAPTTEQPVAIEINQKPNGDAVVTPKKQDGKPYPPGTKVEIPGEDKDGNPITITVTIGDNGSGEVPNDNLPKKAIPGTGTVTEPNKNPTEEVPVETPAHKTPKLELEQDPKTGDVTVTPKRPDGSTYPPGTTVEIPGKDKDHPITVTTDDNGKAKVPNADLPEGKVPGTGKITEPGKPTEEVPVETPAHKTPKLELEQDPKTGDVTVTPKRPDGSTYPPGTTVEIPGKDKDHPITVTTDDNGKAKVPNADLPEGKVPGTGKITEPGKPTEEVPVETPAHKTPKLELEQDPKTGDVTVTPKRPDGSTYPPGTTVEIPGKDKDHPITVTTDDNGKAKVPNADLPEGKVPGTGKITEPGKPTEEVPVETPAHKTPKLELEQDPKTGDVTVTPKRPDGSTYPPGTTVEIPGKDKDHPITVTTDDNGKAKVPNADLPEGKVPGTGKITEPGKPTEEVPVETPAHKTPKLELEQDPKTGDVTVTPKRPDGSTYPPGTTVEIPGKDKDHPITVTTDDNGKAKVPNADLPEGKVPGTGKITEPGKPTEEVPVETPAHKTPKLELEQDPKTGDVTVTPKRPDGSTYPPGTTVEIPGKDKDHPITVTTDDNGKAKVPNADLPEGKVPGTGKITEPGKPTEEVPVETPAHKTPKLELEQDPKTGDVTVTPKRPDGSTYPPGTTVEIPGKDKDHPITVTTDDNGKAKVPNADLPEGKVPGTGKITEPGKPTEEVPVETPAHKTPKLELEQDPKTGDVTVTPKRPDGSTYPPGTTVEIPGKDKDHPITVTTDDNGKAKVPNADLPEGKVPGTGKITEPGKPTEEVPVETPAHKTPKLELEQDPKTGDVTVTPKRPDGSTYPPGTTVEIPGKDKDHPITVTTDDNGKAKVPNADLPEGKVPGTGKITEPGKPTEEVPVETPAHKTPKLELEQDPKTGDVTVTPKRPDGSTYPPGTTVEIPGKDKDHPITVTTDDNGKAKVPNADLPEGKVPGTGKITEPGKPTEEVPVETPAHKTPTIDVERDPKTGDVTVTPKKPDGSTYPPGTTVEIPGENGPITVTIGENGKGKVPNDNLPKKEVPGTAKITEPGKPAVEVPNVTTPGKFTPETPVTEQPGEIEITRKPNGDAVVTPKKPDGSTYPPGTKVEIPGENGTTITVTIGDNGSGEVPNDKLPKGNVPGKGTVTEPNKKPSQPVDVTTPARKTPTIDVERDPKTGDVTVTPKKPDGSTYPPGTMVEIPGENGPITVTIGENGKGKVPNENLPKTDVPGTGKITEPGKPAVEVPNVTTPGKFTPETPVTEKPGEIEITRKPNGNAIVTPKKPDGSTYPPGTKVEIPGENGTTITVTIGDNGSGEIPNDKLPKGNVPGKGTVTEPNKKPSQPVDVTTPARKTPTLDVERDPKTGDVTVTPKKPDGSTYPPGTKVEIPGENGPITVTIGENGKGKVPNENLPKTDVPGTGKITEPGKPAVEVPNVTTPGKFTPETPVTEKPGEIEITRKPNGNAIVTPKKPDGSTYTPGTKVEIPGEDGTTITVTIGDNGSGEVPNDKLPKGNVPGKGTVTEPNKKPSQPVDVTTPARKTPTIDVERDPKTGDVTVTPKKPDGSTYPPGTVVEIPGENGPITVTIGENGKGKVPNDNLPKKEVPGTGKITEPGKPTVEVPNVTTPGKFTPETPVTEQPGEIEITRKPNGDAVVTPKKPDGSTYPPGTVVEIPGEDGTTITVTIGDNGSGEVPNDKLPKGNVPGKGTVTEPNKKPSQPVDVTTPARKTPTLDVEQDPKTGDVTVTPKKPDGSTYPPGTKVEIPGKDGNPIIVTIDKEGKGKVPNSELPEGKVPGTGKITEPGQPTVEVPVITPAKVTSGKVTPDETKKETKRLANTGTTETNTGLAGLGLGILGGLLAAARRRKNDKN